MIEKRPKRPRDLNQWANRVLDIATGEVEDRAPTPEERGVHPIASAMAQYIPVQPTSRQADKSTLLCRRHPRRFYNAISHWRLLFQGGERCSRGTLPPYKQHRQICWSSSSNSRPPHPRTYPSEQRPRVGFWVNLELGAVSLEKLVCGLPTRS
jgi:hypothetical protein